MNKFDATLNSIKKVILEESFNFENKNNFFIDLNLDLINERYCDGGVDIEFIRKNALFFKVNIIELEDKSSIRLESSDKQKLIALLGTFINSNQFDYVCTFIRNSEEKNVEQLQ